MSGFDAVGYGITFLCICGGIYLLIIPVLLWKGKI